MKKKQLLLKNRKMYKPKFLQGFVAEFYFLFILHLCHSGLDNLSYFWLQILHAALSNFLINRRNKLFQRLNQLRLTLLNDLIYHWVDIFLENIGFRSDNRWHDVV